MSQPELSRIQIDAGSERTTTRSHTFNAPFRIGNGEEVFPAGVYDIQTREAAHQGNARTAYVRTSTILIVRTVGTTRYCQVDPAQLDEAQRQDTRSAQSS